VLDKVSLLRRRVEPMNEDKMIDYLTRGLFNENHKSVMMGKIINSIDEYLVEINRLEKKSSPTVTMSEIASLGILVAQGEEQFIPTAQPSSSKEPVDAEESALTLPALAKMIGRLTNKVNQLAGPEEKEKTARHQRGGRRSGRQVHYDHPPQYLVHYPPPIYPGYQLPPDAVLTATGQPGIPERPTMNIVPTATVPTE